MNKSDPMQTTTPTGKQILAWQLSVVCQREGAEACQRGLGRLNNPYAQDQEVEHLAWLDGWSHEAGEK